MTKCESPIEQLLLNAMHYYELDPICQYKIGKYRVDFAFPRARLIIEADGRQFHKGWRKKADYRRDKELTEQGWKVLRFTGREIYHNAFACAHEILRELK